MIKKKELNQQDKETWENYINDPSDIFDKEEVTSKNTQNRYRFKFDLHGFSLDEANKKVRSIIEYCVKNKFRELLLITGKGIHSKSDQDAYISKDLGKLKFSVPEYIKNNSELDKFVISINDAPGRDGGGGAIIVRLKNL